MAVVSNQQVSNQQGSQLFGGVLLFPDNPSQSARPSPKKIASPSEDPLCFSKMNANEFTDRANSVFATAVFWLRKTFSCKGSPLSKLWKIQNAHHKLFAIAKIQSQALDSNSDAKPSEQGYHTLHKKSVINLLEFINDPEIDKKCVAAHLENLFTLEELADAGDTDRMFGKQAPKEVRDNYKAAVKTQKENKKIEEIGQAIVNLRRAIHNEKFTVIKHFVLGQVSDDLKQAQTDLQDKLREFLDLKAVQASNKHLILNDSAHN
jgi:hypothetical protein